MLPQDALENRAPPDLSSQHRGNNAPANDDGSNPSAALEGAPTNDATGSSRRASVSAVSATPADGYRAGSKDTAMRDAVDAKAADSAALAGAVPQERADAAAAEVAEGVGFRETAEAAVDAKVEGCGATVNGDKNGPCGGDGGARVADSGRTLGKRLGRSRKRSLKAAVDRFKRVKLTWCERLPRMPIAEANARAAAEAVVQAERAVVAQRRKITEKQDFHAEAVQCLLLQSFFCSLEPPPNLVTAEERAARALVEARRVGDALAVRLAAARAAAEQADVLVDEEAKERFALEFELNAAFFRQSAAKVRFDELTARRKHGERVVAAKLLGRGVAAATGDDGNLVKAEASTVKAKGGKEPCLEQNRNDTTATRETQADEATPPSAPVEAGPEATTTTVETTPLLGHHEADGADSDGGGGGDEAEACSSGGGGGGGGGEAMSYTDGKRQAGGSAASPDCPEQVRMREVHTCGPEMSAVFFFWGGGVLLKSRQPFCSGGSEGCSSIILEGWEKLL